MSILKGSTTYTRFRVEAPQDFDAEVAFAKTLPARAFRPLDRASQEDRAAGWVEFAAHDATRFDLADLTIDGRSLFTWRVDEFRLPAAAIRKELDAWTKTFAKEQGRPPGRREKAEAKAEIRQTMKRRAEIRTRTVDVCWDVDTNRIDIWTSSRKALDEVQDALEQAFGVHLRELVPAHVAELLGVAGPGIAPTPALATPEGVRVSGLVSDPEREAAADVESGVAYAAYLNGKRFLGREFLTWLLWRSESDKPVVRVAGAPVSVTFVDRLVLKSIADAVVEAQVRGAMAPYAPAVRRDLSRGLLVQQARLRLVLDGREWALTLDADVACVRSMKLPALLSVEDDEALLERLVLVDQASDILQALLETFLTLRASPAWASTVVPELRSWMVEGVAP